MNWETSSPQDKESPTTRTMAMAGKGKEKEGVNVRRWLGQRLVSMWLELVLRFAQKVAGEAMVNTRDPE